MADTIGFDTTDVQKKTPGAQGVSVIHPSTKHTTVDSVRRAHISDTIRKYGVSAENFSPSSTSGSGSTKTRQPDSLRLQLKSDIPRKRQMIGESLPNKDQTLQNTRENPLLAAEPPSSGHTSPLVGHNSSASGPSENPVAIGSSIELESMQNITWKDGYRPPGPSKIPDQVLTLIQKHFKEFKANVPTRIWEPKKGRTQDEGRRVIFSLDGKQDSEIVRVARYLYGRQQQFLAAWLPDEALPDSYQIHIVKFNSLAKTCPTVERNGIAWRMMPYSTWTPSDKYKKKTIWKLIEQQKKNECQLSSDASFEGNLPGYSPDAAPANSTGGGSRIFGTRSSMNRLDKGKKRAVEQDHRQPDVHDNQTPEIHGIETSEDKRRRISISLLTPSVSPFSSRLSELNTQSPLPSSNVVDLHTLADPSATPVLTQERSQQIQTNGFAENYPGLVFVVCKDAQGNIKDRFPFGECDTAQKLFDAVCVSGIVPVDPLGTRLLKITFFPTGDGGYIRPDNDKDFEKVITSKLGAHAQHGHVEIIVALLR